MVICLGYLLLKGRSVVRQGRLQMYGPKPLETCLCCKQLSDKWVQGVYGIMCQNCIFLFHGLLITEKKMIAEREQKLSKQPRTSSPGLNHEPEALPKGQTDSCGPPLGTWLALALSKSAEEVSEELI